MVRQNVTFFGFTQGSMSSSQKLLDLSDGTSVFDDLGLVVTAIARAICSPGFRSKFDFLIVLAQGKQQALQSHVVFLPC